MVKKEGEKISIREKRERKYNIENVRERERKRIDKQTTFIH